MSNDVVQATKKQLKALIPLNSLSSIHLEEIARKAVTESIPAKRYLFREGDQDSQTIYLLSGEVAFLENNKVVDECTASSAAARYPLAHYQPRRCTARANSKITVLKIDTNLLDVMLNWDQTKGCEVTELDENEDDDWITRLLQSESFMRLPASNLQNLMMRMEPVTYKKGDMVISEGEEGDCYYMIKQGRCKVTRRPTQSSKVVKLAELSEGDTFGEDALVSGGRRNASVSMVTDGVLMRVAKDVFLTLLKEPLISQISYEQALNRVNAGAQWLDVRLPGEHVGGYLPGSTNISLNSLRQDLEQLDKQQEFVTYCDTGRRSATAAFLLCQRGFEVYVLDGGLISLPAGVDLVVERQSPSAAPPEQSPPSATLDADESVQQALQQAQQEADAIRQQAQQEAEQSNLQIQQMKENMLVERMRLNELEKQLLAKQVLLEQEESGGAVAADKHAQQLNDALKKCKVLEESLESKEAELELLNNKLYKARSDFEKRSEEVDAENQTLRERLLEKEHELQAEVQNQKENSETLQQSLDKYVQQNMQLQQACESLRSEKSEVDLKLHQLEKQSEQAAQQAQQLEEIRLERDKLASQLDELAQNADQMQQANSEWQQKYECQSQELAGVHAETAQLHDRLQNIEQEKQDVRKTLYALEEQYGSAQEKLKELPALELKYSKLLSESEDLANKVAALQSEQVQLDQQYTAAKETALAASAQAIQEREGLQAQLEGLQEEKLALSQTLVELQKQYQEVQERADAAQVLQEQYSTLQVANNDLQHQLENQAKHTQQQASEFAKQLEEMRAVLQKIDDDKQLVEQDLKELLVQKAGSEQDLAELQAQLGNAQLHAQDRDQLQKQVEVLAAERDAVVTKLQQSLEDNDQAEQVSSAEKDRLSQLLEQAEQDRQNLESRTAQLAEQQCKLEATIGALNSSLEQSEAEKASLRSSLETLAHTHEQEKAVLLEDAQQLRETLSVNKDDIQSELADALAETAQLKTQVTKLQADLDAAGSLAQTRQTAVREFDEKISVLWAEKRDVEERLHLVSVDNDEYVKKQNQLEKALEDTEQQIAQLNSDIQAGRSGAEQIQLDNQALQEKNAELTNQLADMARALDEANERQQAQQSAVDAVEQQRSRLELELHKLQEDLRNLTENDAAKVAEADEWKNEVEELTEAKTQLDERVLTMQQSLNEAEQKIAQLELRAQRDGQQLDQTAADSEELNKLRAELQGNQEELSMTHAELDQLRVTVTELSQELTQVKSAQSAEIDSLDTQLVSLLEEKESLLAQVETIRQASEGTQANESSVIKQLENANVNLKTELQQVKAELLLMEGAAESGFANVSVDLEADDGGCEVVDVVAVSASVGRVQQLQSELTRMSEALKVAEDKAAQAVKMRLQEESARIKLEEKMRAVNYQINNESTEKKEPRSMQFSTQQSTPLNGSQGEAQGAHCSATSRRPRWVLISIMVVVMAIGGLVALFYTEPAVKKVFDEQVSAWFGNSKPVQLVPDEQLAGDVVGEDDSRDVTTQALEQPVVKGREFVDTLTDFDAVAPAMVQIAAGEFVMGRVAASTNFDERPQRRVKVAAFAVSKQEITFAEYDLFAQATGRAMPNDLGWGRADQPVINVAWNDAQDYVRWLSEQTGRSYRLPTEAEWEYLAHSGNQSVFGWGDSLGERNANCFNCGNPYDGERPMQVGQFAENSFGVQDLVGNVMEWVQDCYQANYANAPADASAVQVPGCAKRVARGGSYRTPANMLRVTKRFQFSPQARLDFMGFRVVRD